jgi:hypothetical protein
LNKSVSSANKQPSIKSATDYKNLQYITRLLLLAIISVFIFSMFVIEQIKKPKFPGVKLQGRPALRDDGKWYDQFGELLPENAQRDLEYAARFWRGNQPSGLRETMQTNIEHACLHGQLASAVSPHGMTEDDKQKLSAYRVLAGELGYLVGPYKFHKGSGTVTAPITK